MIRLPLALDPVDPVDPVDPIDPLFFNICVFFTFHFSLFTCHLSLFVFFF